MNIDLSSDIKWFKRFQKRFNKSKSDVEKLSVAIALHTRCTRLTDEMSAIIETYNVKARNELEQNIIKEERDAS